MNSWEYEKITKKIVELEQEILVLKEKNEEVENLSLFQYYFHITTYNTFFSLCFFCVLLAICIDIFSNESLVGDEGLFTFDYYTKSIFITVFGWIAVVFLKYKIEPLGNKEIIKEKNAEIKELEAIINKEIKKEIKKKEKFNKKLKAKKAPIFKEIDKNNNGIIDGLENDSFDLYLKNNEKKISNIKTEYLGEFVMISNHLLEYKKNIQKIYDIIKETEKIDKLQDYLNTLKDGVYAWQLLQARGTYMIDYLVKNKELDFFRLYHSFKNQGAFDSSWQKDVANELKSLNINLKTLIQKTQQVGLEIIQACEDMSFANEQQTQEINNNLNSINSSVKFGNLIGVINTYQNYRTNKKLN